MPNSRVFAGSSLPNVTALGGTRSWKRFQVGLTENPDITLVVAPDLRPSRNLMLNVEARAFRDDAQRQAVLRALAWFVPRHRGLMYWPEEWNDRTAPGRT